MFPFPRAQMLHTSFLKSVAALILFAASSAHAQQPPGPKVHDLGKGVYVFEFQYSNAPFVITDDGVLVMDTYNPFYAKELRKAIEARTDKPVRYVVYSHAHTDHVRGANEFKDTAKIIAQRRQVPRLKYIKEDSFPMPDILFDKEYKLVLGGKEIILKDYGLNHATGVTVMYIPENKLVTAIDIAYVKRLGYYFMPDFNPRAWRDSLREIEKLDFEVAITGHGKPVASRAEFIEFADYLDDLIGQVQKVWNRVNHMGPFKGVEIAKKEVDLSKYKDWIFYKEFRDLNIMAVYHSIDMGF